RGPRAHARLRLESVGARCDSMSMTGIDILIGMLFLVVGLLGGILLGLHWAARKGHATPSLEAERARARTQGEVREGLARLGQQVKDLEQQRAGWQSQLREQVNQVQNSTEA